MSSNSLPTILLSEEPDSISPFLVGDDFELPDSISPFIDDDFEVTGSTSLLLGDDFEETGSISLRLLSDDLSDDFEEIGSISPLLSDDTEESGLVPPRFLGGECAETGFIFPLLPNRECGPLKGSGNVPLVFEGAKSDLEAMKDSASQSLCNGTSSLAVVTHFGNYSKEKGSHNKNVPLRTASFSNLYGHKTVPLKLNCPSPTCERHTGEAFEGEELLEGHVRCKHPQLSFASLA